MRTLLLVLFSLVIFPISWGQTAHPGGFPEAAGPVATQITDLYNFIFWITCVVFYVVTIPILFTIYRFRRKKNPNPAKFSHSTAVELVWTIIPALICAVITYQSYNVMVHLNTMPEEGLTVEVVGYQFGWDFYYPDMGESGNYVASPEPTEVNKKISLPEVERYTKELVIPVDVPIKLHVTSQDVIHAFYAPELGMKIDAMPGRINYAWIQADKPGTYIGQCYELCGSAHGEMFFTVKAVSMGRFVQFVNEQRQEAGLSVLQPKQIIERLS